MFESIENPLALSPCHFETTLFESIEFEPIGTPWFESVAFEARDTPLFESTESAGLNDVSFHRYEVAIVHGVEAVHSEIN